MPSPHGPRSVSYLQPGSLAGHWLGELVLSNLIWVVKRVNLQHISVDKVVNQPSMASPVSDPLELGLFFGLSNWHLWIISLTLKIRIIKFPLAQRELICITNSSQQSLENKFMKDIKGGKKQSFLNERK